MMWLKNKMGNNFSMLHALTVFSLAVGFGVQSAWADGAGNADVLTGQGCMQDEAGFGLNCTANDVRISGVTNIVITDPCTVEPNDTVTFTGDFEMLLTAQARHDVGLWFAEDGDPNGDGALTGTCTAVTPAYAPDPPFLDLDGTTVVDGIPVQDTCGDIDADHNPLIQMFTLTVMCIDDDGDGKLDLPNCTSWRQPGANELCLSPDQAFPGAPSKCNCEPGFNVDVPVPFTGTLEVVKDLEPAGDDGTFNLLIDGMPEASGVGDMGTTGPVTVSAGISTDPLPIGDNHTASETGAGGTDLNDYTTSISCVDEDNDVDNPDGTVFVEPDDAWVCTITNTRIPATLTLEKIVINDNGGTAVEADFTLSATGPVDSISGAGGATGQVGVGTYTLAETNVAGYSASGWTCDDGQSGDQITLESGDDVICSITNDDNEPSLTLNKVVVNDNGGTAVATDFTLSAAGPTPISGDGGASSGANFSAGTYTLSETGPAGYTASDWSCTGGTQNGDQITVGLGESASCEITNDDDAPSLTLTKVVVNDNGGTAVTTDFTLSADGPTPISGAGGASSGADFSAGTYNLSETGPGGYSASDWSCTGGTQNGPQITLALGESASCTITNDDDAPSLTLTKVVVNDNGGTAVATDFTLTATGPTPISGAGGATSGAGFSAGTYDLSETMLANYTASAWSCTGGTQNGAQITLGLGESASCTIANDDVPPSLTLTKVVVNDNGGTAATTDFTLTASGPTPISGAGGATSGAGFSAGTYDLSETGPGDYTASDWSCTGGTQNGAQISLGIGQSASCTITNDDDAPKLTLVKVVDNGANPGGTAVATDWTLTATGPTGFSGQTGVMSDASFDQGTYDLSESGPAGYLASDWSCVGGGTQDDGDTITLGLGDEATCTITNTAQGMTTLLKLTNGVENQVMVWNFTLTGPDVDASDSSPPTTVDFGGVKLNPGDEYTLCETGIPAGWTLEWQVDTDGDGVPDTIIPVVTGVNNDPVGPDGYSRVYDPNYVAPPGTFTNDTRCVNFVVGVGETLAFQINNSFPGGEPRTIGFWKNWNTCTGGNQTQTAANNGGPAEGWFILDDLLNNPGYTIGVLTLDGADCEDAVSILDKRSIDDGRKRASDGAYNLASQLLAAQVNLSAGAETCMEVVDAVNAGQTLLAGIGFDGTGGYLKGKQAGDANALAATLDEYNNGNLCN